MKRIKLNVTGEMIANNLIGSLLGQCKAAARRGRWLARALILSVLFSASFARAEKPEIDLSYAEGQLVYMIGPHIITNASPNLLRHAEELYIVVYPLNPGGSNNLGTLTLPSGYQPNCDPCFHPGLPLQFIYHDHILTGAPGLGNSGTAGEYEAPWKIIVLMYKPEIAFSNEFQPIKSAADLDAGEAAGKFLPINPGAENPFELDTGNVLICPLVSPHG